MIFSSPKIHTLWGFCLYLAVFFLCVQSIWAVEIKTVVDRNPVSINESFQLTYTATESPDDDPDFTPLKKNFDIINQNHTSSSFWVNGQFRQSIQWILTVIAKQTGDLLIPAIAFGDDVSQPLNIEISNKIVPKLGENEDIFLQVEILPSVAYVQSQVLYTLRLYYKIQLRQARLTEPTMENAVIEKLGGDKDYKTVVKGITYAVKELKYAIFPQKSGVSTIEPLVLTTETIVTNTHQRFNSWFNSPTTKTERITSNAVTLEVLAVPKHFKEKHWIPAQQVEIKDQWSGDIHNMKVGEPLTRTLSLIAKGVTAAQLPELQDVIITPQLKIYPDQAVLTENKEASGITALREEKIAFIPSKPGRYTLAAIEVPWFNIQTQKIETAHIPEITMTAIATATPVINMAESETPLHTTAQTAKPVPVIFNNPFWMWISLLLALGWLVTLYFFFKRQQPKQKEKPINSKTFSLKESIKNLRQACNNNDPFAAKNALLAWGKLNYNSKNLIDTALQCEARLRDEIYLLSQNLYAEQTMPWQGKKLFQYFVENIAQEKIAKHRDDALEPLYKV